MNTLGLSFDFHDASAALVTDGMVVAASEEERFTRKKHDPDFPLNAIRFCLETGKLTADDLDAVVFYEKPWLKFDRILKHSVVNKEDPKSFEETIRYWLQKRKYCPVQRIVEALNIDSKRIHFVEHHQAHAASAFYCSPFKRATIVTLDGVGEYETCTVSIGEGSQIVKMYATELPHSLGLLYSAFTAFLGFEVNEGEYKVMGMAGFGQPKFLDRFRALVNLLPDGRFEVNQKYFNFSASGEVPFDSALSDFIGYGRREPESRFELGDPHINPEGGSIEWESRYYADIAASIQALTEEVISHVVLKAVEATEIPDVCIAGGVGLNSSANGKLQKLIPGKLYIHPASGDGGGSIGAALFHHHMNNHMRRHGPLDSAFLGRGTNDAEIESTLKKHFISSFCKYESRERLFTEIAKRLASGEIGGVLQGRAEWGPRALGGRSIIADPTRSDMKQKVNEKIKFREPFRPFAPAVLAQEADKFFEVSPSPSLTAPECFMLAVAPVREEMKTIIPAVTHVDGTARLQFVHQETNPFFYGLISAFNRERGVPVILNTSFNLRGEPIVNSPEDALFTFFNCDLDFLVLEDFLVWKEAIG